MIDNELKQLAERDNRPLESLERDIWFREADTKARQQNAKRMMAWQSGVLVVAIICSASFGVARATSSHFTHGTLFARADLSPSTLLLGENE